MGRQIGYSKLTCDRCGRTAFLQSGNADAQSWYDVNHLTSASAASAQAPTHTRFAGTVTRRSSLSLPQRMRNSRNG